MAGVLLEEELLVDQRLEQVERGGVLLRERVQLGAEVEAGAAAQQVDEVTLLLFLTHGVSCSARKAG